MKFKTELLSKRLMEIFSRWPSVECISLNEASSEDPLDPYFALVMDVFYTGSIPAPEERYASYGSDISAFESSNQNKKDRFLAGDMPVRIEFKSTAQIEELVSYTDTKQEALWFIKDSGTYGFYRLVRGELMYSRSGWIDGIRRRLVNVDDVFWNRLREVNQSKMEHFLNDLGAALFQSDDFYYLISASGFIKYACLTLFCINRRFEPSHRSYHNQVTALPVQPDGFKPQFELFLIREPGATLERRYSLAQLIAKGIIAL
jgi:hypothetical protein